VRNQEVWDTHYRRAKAQQHYPDENVVRLLKKQFHEKKEQSVALDLGAGSGRHLSLLSEHFEFVIASDFSREGLKAYKGVQATLPEFPLSDQSIDFILCWGVLHYLTAEKIPKAVSEIHRALKLGGSIFLTLRSDTDTHLATQLRTGDLQSGHAQLFSKAESLDFFQDFKESQYGYICRQPLGEEGVVAHHMILATK